MNLYECGAGIFTPAYNNSSGYVEVLRSANGEKCAVRYVVVSNTRFLGRHYWTEISFVVLRVMVADRRGRVWVNIHVAAVAIRSCQVERVLRMPAISLFSEWYAARFAGYA